MPTAAKLFAAVAFAAVAFFAAEAFKPLMPEGTQFGVFSQVCALIGALCGWFVMGGLAGRSYWDAAGAGVRTSATIVFWVLLLFAIYEMTLLSMKLRYDGPTDAILGAFDLFVKYFKMLAKADILAILIGGGGAAGALVEWASRRWS